MKNSKGFTLIELLAVIIILGVIMVIAVPNVVSTIDRNKKDTFLEDAQRLISAAEYKMRSDVSIEWPKANQIVILKLESLDSSNISISPYDTEYSLSKSFVVIKRNADSSSGTTEYTYDYYVTLVACTDQECANLADDSVGENRGINFLTKENMNSAGRFDYILQGADVLIYDVDDTATIDYFKSYFGVASVKVY